MQTLWWRAPEVLFGSKEYNEAIDVWSFGMIFAEMAAGSARFQEGSPVTAAVYAEALFRQLGTPDELLAFVAPDGDPACAAALAERGGFALGGRWR